MALDIFKHHDGIVDHDPHREGHSQQRHHVEGKSKNPDQTKSRNQGNRNRQRDNQRGPRSPEKDKNCQDREQCAKHQGKFAFGHRLTNPFRKIDEARRILNRDAWRQDGLNPRQPLEDFVHDPDGIAATLLHNADPH